MLKGRSITVLASTGLALCAALSGCSSEVNITRDQKTKALVVDELAMGAIMASDGLIRHMSARCDGNLVVMGGDFMNGEFKEASPVTTHVDVEKPDDVAKANGDFDELVNVTYSVDAPFVRVYGVKGFGAINAVTGEETDGYGNKIVADFKPEQSRWTQPSSDRRIAAFSWMVKNGRVRLQSTTLGGFDVVAYQAGMNKDVPFWQGVHQELPTFMTDNIHKALPTDTLPSCDQMRNPLASLSNVLTAIGGPKMIDQFFVYDSTIAWGQASPEERHNIEQYAWAARVVTYKAGGLTPPKVPADVLPPHVSEKSTAAAVEPATALASSQQPSSGTINAAAPETSVPPSPTPASSAPPQPMPTLIDVRDTTHTNVQPSFDCAKASTGAERLICSSPDLAQLDVKLMTSYKQLLTNATHGGCAQCRSNEIAEQRKWIATVRNACSSAACMITAYKKRVEDLDAALDGEAQD